MVRGAGDSLTRKSVFGFLVSRTYKFSLHVFWKILSRFSKIYQTDLWNFPVPILSTNVKKWVSIISRFAKVMFF